MLKKVYTTKDMDERIRQCLVRTVEAIRPDYKGREKNLPLVALDYLELHGDDREAATAFLGLNYFKQSQMLREIFP